MSLQNGLYIIRPGASDSQALLINKLETFPPPDVPVKVGEKLIERWIVRQADKAASNTVNIYAGKGNPDDYKWIRKNNTLFASALSAPGNFRVESTGSGSDELWTIFVPSEDLFLTLGEPQAIPRLSFEPADGSSKQRFGLIKIDSLD